MDHQENEILDPVPEQEQVLEQTPVGQETPPSCETSVTQEPETHETESDTANQDMDTEQKGSGLGDSPYVAASAEPAYTPGYTIPKEDAVPQKKKKRGRIWIRIVAAILILALTAGSCAITANVVNDYWEDRTKTMSEEFQQKLNALEKSLETQINKIENDGTSVSGTPNVSVDGMTPGQVYAKNVDSTVLVYSVVNNMGYSTGSGFILTPDGYVVTNYHVVEGGKEYLVVTTDNVQHEATLVGGDATNDVAVLKIQAEGLQAVNIGSSDALIVGDQVAAIGNPLGELTSTLTVGFVSAKGRYVTTESTTINMLQTDCAINSGNSGGPLFNMKGEVVGITSAKYSGTSSSGATIEGIGFAIPIDDVMGLIEDIIEVGYVNSAYLGIEVNNQNEITAGLPDGAYVAKVTPGYCAEAAGVLAGDYIIELDGHEIATMNDLTRILRRLDPGTTTTITVLRNGKKLTLNITLDARPRDTGTDMPTEQMPLPEEGDYDEWYEYFKWFFENRNNP